MIEKSVAKLYEICALCCRTVPDGRLVLRNTASQNIICLLCIIDIAEIEIINNA